MRAFLKFGGLRSKCGTRVWYTVHTIGDYDNTPYRHMSKCHHYPYTLLECPGLAATVVQPAILMAKIGRAQYSMQGEATHSTMSASHAVDDESKRLLSQEKTRHEFCTSHHHWTMNNNSLHSSPTYSKHDTLSQVLLLTTRHEH